MAYPKFDGKDTKKQLFDGRKLLTFYSMKNEK